MPPLANLPTPDSAVLGSLKGAEFDRIAREAARTVPPREHGGNCDIKNLSKGTRIYFPVYVNGAKLSMGDLHFSQGDGEVTFCGGIEMAGWLDLHVDIIKGGMAKYNIVNNPVFKPGPVEPRYTEYLVFEGISVHETTGQQLYMDAHVAYRNACLNAIEYLKTAMGFTGSRRTCCWERHRWKEELQESSIFRTHAAPCLSRQAFLIEISCRSRQEKERERGSQIRCRDTITCARNVVHLYNG